MSINPFYKGPANQFEQDDEIELLQTVIDKTKRELHVATLVKIRKGSYDGGNLVKAVPMPLRDGKAEKAISCLVAINKTALKSITDADDAIGTVIFTDTIALNELNAYEKGIDYPFQSSQALHTMSSGVLINARKINSDFESSSSSDMMRIDYSSITYVANNVNLNFKVDSSAFTFKDGYEYYLAMYRPSTNINETNTRRGRRWRLRIVRSYDTEWKTIFRKDESLITLQIRIDMIPFISMKFWNGGRGIRHFAFFKAMEHALDDVEHSKDRCVSNILCLPVNFYSNDNNSFMQIGYWR